MHPPAEVKFFPDQNKNSTPEFETENKILEMLPEHTPTIDLLDENVIFEVTYSLGDDVPDLSEFLLDSSIDIPTEDVQHKPDLISESQIESGHDVSSEIPTKNFTEEITPEVPLVSSSSENDSKEETSLITESQIESSHNFEYDTAPEPVIDSVPEKVEKETCQEVALDSTCVGVVAHSRSCSPFADDSSCSSFHDDEYISHSSTEDLTEGASSHYFKSEKIDAVASEQTELSTDTACLTSEQAIEPFLGESTAAVELLDEMNSAAEVYTTVTTEVFKSEPFEQIKCSPEPLEHTIFEPEEYAAVTSKVFTPEPSDEPKQFEEIGVEHSEALELSHEAELVQGTETEPVEYAAVTAKVFTPEPSHELELTPEPEAIPATVPPQHSAITTKIFPESVVYIKGVHEEQTEVALAEHTKCSSSENFVLTEVEPSQEFVLEKETTPCSLLPAERVLAAQKVPPAEEVLSETMAVETTLSGDNIVQIESELPDQCFSETAKTDSDVILTEVEPLEQITPEETVSFCPTVPPTEAILSETLPVETTLSADNIVQIEAESPDQCLSETAMTDDDVVLTEVEPSEQITTEEAVLSCLSMPAARLLVAQQVSAAETVLSETMPFETVLPGDDLVQTEIASSGQFVTASAADLVLTEVERSEQIAPEETALSCPAMQAERLVAAQKVPPTEAVSSVTMPAETTLSADKTVQIESESPDQCLSETAKTDDDVILTEVEPSKQITETVLCCPFMPAERLPAAQKVSSEETVLSQIMPTETSLSVDASTVDATAEEADTVWCESIVEVEEPLVIHTSQEMAVALEESGQPTNVQTMSLEQEPADSQSKGLEDSGQSSDLSTNDKTLSIEQYFKEEDDLSDYDDLPDDIHVPSDFLMEDMTEELEVETEDLARFPISIEDEPTDTYQDFEPVVVKHAQEDWEMVEADDRTPAETTDIAEITLTEEPRTETDFTSSDLVSVDHSGGEVEDKLKSEVSGAASDAAVPDKTLELNLISTPLLEEMEQIVSDMSSLAEDISKSPVLAPDEFPFEPSSTTKDLVDQSTKEADIAGEPSSPVSCHSADVSMAGVSEQEMPEVDTESSPESLTPTPGDLESSGFQLDIARAADDTTMQPLEPQATEETALDFSSAQRGKLTSISSVSEIIQDLPAHSSVTEQENIVLESSAVSVDVVAVSDPTREELSAVDNLLQEVSEYSQLQNGSSGQDKCEEVYLTGQFVSEPVDEAELVAGACIIEEDGSLPVEGLKVNVFVMADQESPEPSSPLTKYDVVEDLSVSVDEPFITEDKGTVESSVLPVDVVTEDVSTMSNTSFTIEDVPASVGTFVIQADADQEDSSTKLDISFESESLPAEEVTLSSPAAEAETSIDYEFSTPTQSETQDDDSPAMRAIRRRQNYLAEQAKKKELFEGSGHIEHTGAVDLCEKPVEILPVCELPQCSTVSYPTNTKSREGKMSTTSMHIETRLSAKPFDTVPKTIVVQVESTEIAGPPKELVSDLLTDNKRVITPERYASLSRPLRVYKQVSSDIEDDTSKVIEKRVDEWVTANTNAIPTTTELSTVQNSVSESAPSASQVTENIQISPQPLSEHFQFVPKPGFVIRPQAAENVQPPSQNVKNVQRPGFAISRQTTENIQTGSPPLPENVQVVKYPDFVLHSQTTLNIKTDPPPPSENVQVLQRPGFVMRPQTTEDINLTPQSVIDNIQIPQKPESAESPKPEIEDANVSPETLPGVESVPMSGRVFRPKRDYNTLPRSSKSSKDASTPKRAGSLPRSSSAADRQHKTTQSSPTEEGNSDIPTVKMDPPPSGHEEKDDIELVRAQPETPSLKKSRSLGGSLKKLFRRGRKRSRDHGETSRESSYSRSSTRNASQGPSREGSLTRGSGGQTSSLTRSGQLPDQKGEVGRSHWSRTNTQNEYMEREVDVSPRHQPGDTTYPVLQQEPSVLQPRGVSSHEPDVGRGHWSRPKSGEQLDVARQSYETNSAPPGSNTETEDIRRGHWSKSKSPARTGPVIITTPKQEPLDVVSQSYDTMAAPPDTDSKPEVRKGHWSKSKSPTRSTGGVVITSRGQEVPDLVASSSTKVITPEVIVTDMINGKTTSSEKIDFVKSSEVPPELAEDVRRGHWSKSKSPSRERIGQIVISTDPSLAASTVEVDLRRGYWTKSKSRSPKRESGPSSGVDASVTDSQTYSLEEVKPAEVPPPSTAESSDKVKVKAKPTKVEPVKSKPVKAKPTKDDPTVKGPVQTPPEDPIVAPPPSAKKGHWSKSTTDSNQPVGGGVVVVKTDVAVASVMPVDPADVHRGHWTKPKTNTS
ncbi:uncharacterized protein LOC110451288 isoform X2 [Mizuhopecten yessoensis]|uniref:uncharacterized protein LOC110451288 isoform X2 n=1 Tax=Mizuhopecten yessoensis TaxID=6573 RepID=UPI000B4599E5|nr:uncharacterized protein LOC110451288 isoform X2 [Mizuhopecten yessoensis]